MTIAPADRTFAVDLGGDLTLLRRVLRAFVPVCENSDEFREIYFMFHAAARAGVEHPHADLTTGRAALDEVRKHALVTVGRDIRNKYIAKLTYVAGAEVLIESALIVFNIL